MVTGLLGRMSSVIPGLYVYKWIELTPNSHDSGIAHAVIFVSVWRTWKCGNKCSEIETQIFC